MLFIFECFEQSGKGKNVYLKQRYKLSFGKIICVDFIKKLHNCEKQEKILRKIFYLLI